MKKVLVLGGGGREHAIVDALSRSPQVGKIYCAPGNAGIAQQAECLPLKETQVHISFIQLYVLNQFLPSIKKIQAILSLLWMQFHHRSTKVRNSL